MYDTVAAGFAQGRQGSPKRLTETETEEGSCQSSCRVRTEGTLGDQTLLFSCVENCPFLAPLG